jgi:hypothetical protein
MKYEVTIASKYENLVEIRVIDIPDDRIDQRYIMSIMEEISPDVKRRGDYHITKIEPA